MLPDDYSRCLPTDCDKRSRCERWIQNSPPLPIAAFPQYVSTVDFSADGDECRFFIERK